MKRKILFALLGLFATVLMIGGVKALQIKSLMAMASSMVMPPTVVGASEAIEQEWELTLSAVGSLEAVQGVTITADIPGRVTEIHLQPGSHVKAGEVLVSQDVSNEQAQMRAAEASADLARANLVRVKELYKKGAASKAEYDGAIATHKQAVAQVDNIASTIQKKKIKAPFDGRLGIRQINLGQDLGTGDPIVSLQAVHPIFVNFYVPQGDLPKLALGLTVRVKTNAVPDKEFIGTITAIDPEVDPSTRNVKVQATLQNNDEKLLPGMFANVKVVLPNKIKVLAVPLTAIAYATYGDSVFVVGEKKNEKTGQMVNVAQQQFVRLGKTLGDFVEVKVGIKAGDIIVNAGVFKLRNGAEISINNDSIPEFKLDPQPEDS